ncbi:MAG: lysophospholipid acyltransferase family protein [Opitutales bacterium]
MSTLSTFSLPKRILLSFLWLFMCVLAKTLRIKHDDKGRLFLRGEIHNQSNENASFFLFWHNQLLLTFLLLIVHKKKFPPFTVLVSSNKSADIFAALLEIAGYSVVRGSANNKSLQALKGIHKAIKKHHVIAYAADGPTGPIYQFKPGAVFLSHKYKVPIDLIYMKPARFIAFKTWDRLKLPLPFTQVQFDWCRVMPDEFEANTSDSQAKEGLNQSVSILESRMQSITGDFTAN